MEVPIETLRPLVGAHLLVHVDPGEHWDAVVSGLDEGPSIWILTSGGHDIQLPVDLNAVWPGKRGRVYIGDSDEFVNCPDWILSYRRDRATGELTPAPPEQHPLIGARAIVGITRISERGSVMEQWHGTVVEVTERGISLATADAVHLLPPDVLAFRPADPGEYRLRSTGEVVRDPDLLAYWSVIAESPP